MREFEASGGNETEFRENLGNLRDYLNRFMMQMAVIAAKYPQFATTVMSFSTQITEIQSWVGIALMGPIGKSVPYHAAIINQPLSNLVSIIEAIKKMFK